MKIVFATFIVLLTGACSNKVIYDSVQSSNRNACSKLPSSEYDDCMERASKSYDAYQTERREASSK